MVNTDVTAPGAMLALGLMYLRTNLAAVAALLDIPDTEVCLMGLAALLPCFMMLPLRSFYKIKKL